MTSSESSYNYDFLSWNIIDNRFILLRKIGKGNFSDVWMSLHVNKKKEYTFCALKILSKKYESKCAKEIFVSKRINCNKCHYLNSPHSIFNFRYDDDEYIGIQYELFYGSLYDLLKTGIYYNGLPLEMVKKIGKQIMYSLVELHEEVKVIHADLSPENILLSGNNFECFKLMNLIESFNIKELLKKNKNLHDITEYLIENITESGYNSSKETDESEKTEQTNSETDKSDDEDDEDNDDTNNKDEVDSGDDLSSYDEDNPRNQSCADMICDMDGKKNLEKYYNFSKNHVDKYLITPKIKLTDFGNIIKLDNLENKEIQVRYYRAPEIILDSKYDKTVDFWSVGCILFELLTGDILFNPKKGNKKINQDFHHLYLMEKFLGPIPNDMIENSKRGELFYEKKEINNKIEYKLRGVEEIVPLKLSELLIDKYNFVKENANYIENILKKCLSYKRTYEEIIKDDFFYNVLIDY